MIALKGELESLKASFLALGQQKIADPMPEGAVQKTINFIGKRYPKWKRKLQEEHQNFQNIPNNEENRAAKLVALNRAYSYFIGNSPRDSALMIITQEIKSLESLDFWRRLSNLYGTSNKGYGLCIWLLTFLGIISPIAYLSHKKEKI